MFIAIGNTARRQQPGKLRDRIKDVLADHMPVGNKGFIIRLALCGGGIVYIVYPVQVKHTGGPRDE